MFGYTLQKLSWLSPKYIREGRHCQCNVYKSNSSEDSFNCKLNYILYEVLG